MALTYFCAGCLLTAQFLASGNVFFHREHFTVELAGDLASSGSFRAALVRGILGNWLLCMAVWQATAAQDVTGKLLGVMFPVSAYVTMVSCCCWYQAPRGPCGLYYASCMAALLHGYCDFITWLQQAHLVWAASR
jgi:hypothetical protein